MKQALDQALSSVIQAVFGGVLGKRAAVIEGEVVTRGLAGDVQILRDEHGVPSIVAGSEDDAWFGLGFCHGQDRAGQLEILLRTVRGTLAEIAGPEALPIDRLSRRLDLRGVGRSQLRAARPEVRAQIEAYARGVNAGTTHGGPRAHDLVLFGCAPTPFEPEDAQGLMVMLCFALASNWDAELVRLEMLSLDGEEALRSLDAPYPAHLVSSLPPYAAVGPSAERLAHDLQALAHVLPLGGASNAWAVDGSRTTSGRPILAADPHLEPLVPPHWYLAHLVAPGLRVRGACFVGIPGFAVGHNEQVAWGVTAAHADNTDLFLEEIGPDGRSIREGDRFVPCRERLEAILIKGGETVVERVLETPRGPIVGPAFDGAHAALSIRATWRDPRRYTGLLRAQHAKSTEEMQALFQEAAASSVCVISADVEGHIGWRLGVEIPRRKRGFGTLPLPGWEEGNGWEESYVPFAEMPFTLDPPEGYVATANNAPSHEPTPYLGVDWLDGYRQQAIVEALAGKRDWDLASMTALQRSVRSIPWEELRPTILCAEGSAGVSRAVALLRAWDGQMSHDSIGASVYALFIAEITRRVVEQKAPRTARRALGEGFNPMLPHNTMFARRLGHIVRLLREQPPGFFAGGWAAPIAASLEAAVERLTAHRGAAESAWAWGEVRPLRLVHLFSRVNPLLDRVFGIGPLPGRGDSSTIVQGTVDLLDPLKSALGIPNLRAVIDLGDLPRSRFSLLGGQSGNPLSPHYQDQVAPFAEAGVELSWSDESVALRARHRLCLRATGLIPPR
jgi:penicillin amidase